MIRIEIRATDSSLAAAQLRARIEAIDYSDLQRQIVRDLEKLHENYFAAEAGPEGRWAPLAAITIARKGFATVLEETDRLRLSLAKRTSDSIREVTRNGSRWTIKYGTTRPYASIHQQGAQYFSRARVATVRIPKRVHVGIRVAEAEVIKKRVAVATVRQLVPSKSRAAA